MNKRNATGLLVLAAIVASVLYLWQPWNPGDAAIKLGLDLQGGLRVVLQADEENPSETDLDTARNIVENRVNEFGVSEPLVQTSGTNRIVVELPGLSAEDQDRALGLIGQQAVLEFRLVKPDSISKIGSGALTVDDLEDVAFTGEILSDAQADYNRVGGATLAGAVVRFNIKNAFAGDFAKFTGENIGRNMAIVLDGVVQTAPTINGTISNSGEITGIGTIDEAYDTALVLRSGSLPIKLNQEEFRVIGPTLGHDSIAAGKTAAMIGGLAVVVIILLYYGPLFGGVLTFGLALVLLFLFGMLAALGAVLTLPGLAGLVLTIGAAVDGNVISFERIKEELRAGKGLRLAMKNGFGQSLSAILDANFTTLLAAMALYQYTTGAVRGFAITLSLGIVAAVFVNTVVVPFLLDVLTLKIKKTFLPTGFYLDKTKLRFLRFAPIVLAISGLLALGSIGVLSARGLNLSVDFTGGTNALLEVSKDTSVTDVRKAIDDIAIEGINGSNSLVQEVSDATATLGDEAEASSDFKLISVKSRTTEGSTELASALAAKLGAKLRSADFVGPAVGSDLRAGALKAMLVSLVLILLYVAWRFWPTWIVAIAAILAVIHDVAITLGGLTLTGAEFSIPVLAALLFVVGYSLNDSIIIADRIRENFKKVRAKDYAEIVELSVNQTLSRTVMTSLTTLLPVIALLLFGGQVLRDFSLTLLIGIAVGTYSSIFILAPMVVWFRSRNATKSVKRRGRARA